MIEDFDLKQKFNAAISHIPKHFKGDVWGSFKN